MRTAIIFAAIIVGECIIHAMGAPDISEEWTNVFLMALAVAFFWDLASGGDK